MYEGIVIFYVNEKYVYIKNEICYNILYIIFYFYIYIYFLKGEFWLCN